MKLARDLALLMLGLVIGVLISASSADDMRAEAGLGVCRHHLAADASWRYAYGNYQTDMRLSPECGQLSLAWLPIERGRARFGLRASYVDLGSVRANNTFPSNEQAYFVAKDTRTAVASSTSSFTGTGTANGFTVGPAVERSFTRDVSMGLELGVAYLYTTWHVTSLNGMQTAPWEYADGWTRSLLGGVNARWKWLFASVRVYANVHASRANVNYQYIGPTSGPLVQGIVGVSIPL